MSDDRDPYENIRSDQLYAAAVKLALASEPAQFIRSRIVDALVDAVEDGEPTTDYLRGHRLALRTAYLLAGGECDGSAAGWARIEHPGD